MSQQANLLILIAEPGTPVVIPAGFLWASINPAEDVTYTITNSLSGEMAGVSEIVTPAISIPFTFPSPPSLEGFKAHTVTVTGGNATIVYTNGN